VNALFDPLLVLVAPEDFYCAGETFAVQILANHLVDIRRIAVGEALADLM
jgi:hypothetical protein